MSEPKLPRGLSLAKNSHFTPSEVTSVLSSKDCALAGGGVPSIYPSDYLFLGELVRIQ
jgi:hypothetical protein